MAATQLQSDCIIRMGNVDRRQRKTLELKSNLIRMMATHRYKIVRDFRALALLYCSVTIYARVRAIESGGWNAGRVI